MGIIYATVGFTVGDICAYAAVEYLLLDCLDWHVPSELAKAWQPLLLRFNNVYEETSNRRPQLLARLIEIDEAYYCRCLEAIIRSYSLEESHGFYRAREFGKAWSHGVEELFTGIALDKTIHAKTRESLGKVLLEHDSTDFRLEVQRLVADNSDSDESIFCASLLLQMAPSRSWKVLVPTLRIAGKSREQILHAALPDLALDSGPLSALDEAQAAELYLFIEDVFPFRRRRQPGSGSYIPNVADHADDIKRRLIELLRNRGTDQAVEAFDRLLDELPEQSWLRRYREEASLRARQAGWLAPEPRALWEVIDNGCRRLVRSERELLVVIAESLRRLQDRLSGETPMAPFLWEGRDDERRHKPEDRISDFLKDHFRMDLSERKFIIHREVQVFNLNEKGIGERTDLLVEAVSEDREQVFSVIIEVKGDWHREVITALKDQLVGKYLAHHPYRTGLYLVLWSGEGHEKSVEQLEQDVAKQTNKVTDPDRLVEDFILDITLPRN